MRGNESLSAKQERVIDLLVQGRSVAYIAEQNIASEATIHRWKNDALFHQVYMEARRRAVQQSFGELQGKFSRAVETLDRHLDAEKTIPRDQIKAAEVVIDKTIQTASLTERIQELEAEVEQLRQSQEQGKEYIVQFDLRLLTKDQRDLLKDIDASLANTSINSDE